MCHTCLLVKCLRALRNAKTIEAVKMMKKVKQFHLDEEGSMKQQSLGESRYFFTLLKKYMGIQWYALCPENDRLPGVQFRQ